MKSSAGAAPLRVLLVEADEEDARRVRDLVAQMPARVELDWAPSFEAGFHSMTSGLYDAHLVDSRLGPRSGVDLLRAYREAGGGAPVLLLADASDRALDLAAMESGAAGFLTKDRLDAELLERSVRYAAEMRRHQGALRRAREDLQKRVEERTAALETMNAALAAEVAERQRAEHKLRNEDRRKNEFLATLAHELRNPLAPIVHATAILVRMGDSDSEEGRARDIEARRVIERQVTHLVRLIDDLLDLSRMTHGKLDLRHERVLLSTVVESALEAVRHLLLGRRHGIEIALPEAPIPLYGDPVRLTQILTNLLSNAAKYTEPGGRVRIEGSRDGDAAVVSVIDSGIGIPAAELELIFTMFGQSARAHDAVHGGLGIGLALASRLSSLHGGSLTATSEGPGRGSTFTLRLPLAGEPAAAAVIPVHEPPALPRRILVVDDNVDAALTLAELLHLDGHETYVAHDGPSAVDEAKRLRPDAVILDIGLPGFSGLEVARRLRAEPSLSGVLLLALSGWVQPNDLARSKEAGIDHHLAKPVSLATLERLLRGGTA
jgi:signal transduction histidine kinase